MTSVVVTGGCGFIGSNFVHFLRKERPDWSIVNLDALTYAGNLANVADLQNDPQHRFARVDVADKAALGIALAAIGESPKYVFHFAAESHVDRSILGPEAFVRTNVHGTLNLLEYARANPTVRHVQVSTDEVYGSLGTQGRFTETTPIEPSSPYSASKASADLLVRAYHKTFGLDAVITRCSNNYGPWQFPEKLIPLCILNARDGKELPVYGDGSNVRNWIHVGDHCAGVLAAAEAAAPGEVYAFGGDDELPNLTIVQTIADLVCGHRDLIRFVRDRPGHDWRYSTDSSKARRDLGWRPQVGLEQGLRQTVRWYLDNARWAAQVQNQEYLLFYDQLYGNR